MKFRKKPVVIEAHLFTVTEEHFPSGDGWIVDSEGRQLMFMQWPVQCTDQGDAFIVIQTLEGEFRAGVGDWIIRGVAGEFYPCKPEIFDATYEPAEEGGNE